jgi:hypothetical protein
MLMRRDGHPRATKGTPYVFEHILVMEKHLGRYISAKEEIHHINEDKKDNRIENLQLMTNKSQHRTHHNMGNTIRLGQHIDTSDRFCFRCGSNKTVIHPPDKNRKTPYPMWYHLEDDKINWYCKKCWRNIRYQKLKK